MSGKGILFDTNVVIYKSKGLLKVMPSVPDAYLAHISLISYIELLGFSFQVPAEEAYVLTFCRNATILPIDREVAEICIGIRKENRIKLPDAVIAATALVHDLALVTHNVKDFAAIRGLELIDPFDRI